VSETEDQDCPDHAYRRCRVCGAPYIPVPAGFVGGPDGVTRGLARIPACLVRGTSVKAWCLLAFLEVEPGSSQPGDAEGPSQERDRPASR
jgi:hypothetical protein